MLDGSDAVADWPVLNAMLNVASGASWVAFHHGGGVGIGNSLHAGQVIVADGTPESSMESLQRRGVVFLLCNNALKRWSGRLEKQGSDGGTAAEIHADLTAHALPGVVIVPDVLIAMTKAHERGFSYARS